MQFVRYGYFRGAICCLLLFALLAVLSFNLTSVFADSKQKNDFGAETIEELEQLSSESDPLKPLPVEQVEEKPSDENEDIFGNPRHLTALNDKNKKQDSPVTNINDPNVPANLDLTSKLNGNDVDIAVLVKTLSKITKRNYILDSSVKGKVTIHLESPVTVQEALRIFDSVLLLKGFTTVPIGKNFWKVIPAKDAKQTTVPQYSTTSDSSTPSDALVTQLVRLKNTQASELQPVLVQFISKDGILSAFAGTNSLIMIDSAANIKRLNKLIQQLDVPALDQDITIIPIAHAQAKDIAEKINEILGDKDGKNQDALNSPFPRGIPVPQFPARSTTGVGGQPTNSGYSSTTSEKKALPLKLIPDDRTNSLIVVADALLTEKVRALTEQLDSKVDNSGGRFFVYRLQHADAEELSTILNSLISGATTDSSSSSGGQKSRSTGSSLSRQQSEKNQNPAQQVAQNRSSTTARQSSGLLAGRLGGSNTGEGEKVNFEGEVAIAADPSTNSLVINAIKSDYEKIKDVIQALDVRRKQVLVEATILEVSLDKEESTGIEFTSAAGSDDFGAIAQSNFGGITNLVTNPTLLSDFTLAAASSGSIVLPGNITIPSQAILINALSKNSNVNVLSSPTIVSTDNQEAEIVVGENVPFVTSTSTNQTNLNNTFNQIDRQDVGITLRITPQISSGDFVTLKIFAEISGVVSGTRGDPNGPTTTVRTTETTVEVKSGQMVATGGLISDEVTDAARGVPFLQDVPILGNFFRKDQTIHRRKNLLVFITPKIIKDQYVAREATKERTKFLESEIEHLNSEPDRAEILKNEKIDNVVDTIPQGEIAPTTIIPPRNNSNNEQDLKIKVSPQLPKISNDPTSRNDSLVSESSIIGGSPPKLSELDTHSDKAYIVLRRLTSGDDNSLPSNKVPFKYVDNQHTVGIELSVDPNTFSGKFFEVGRRYSYSDKSGKINFVCLGKYSNPEEARKSHPTFRDIKDWSSISIQDTMALGHGPWFKG